MKTQQVLNTTTVIVTAAIQKFRYVGYNGAPCAAAAAPLGIADTDQEVVGQTGAVNTHGILIVESGGVFAPGDALEADAQGRAVKQNAGIFAGRAVDASTAAGQFPRSKH